ncbi:MAG: ester cyclase [Chloroflexota bacterium]
MSSQDNKETVRKFYEAVTSGNLGEVDRFISAEFVDHSPSPGQGPGLQGAKDTFQQYHNAFPGFRMEVEDLIAEGDKVVVRGTARGRHDGQFLGIPPTGKDISVPLIDILRLSGGKIVEHWGLQDDAALFGQLGISLYPSEQGRRAA